MSAARGGVFLLDGCRFGVHNVCRGTEYRPSSGTWVCSCSCHDAGEELPPFTVADRLGWEGREAVLHRLAM